VNGRRLVGEQKNYLTRRFLFGGAEQAPVVAGAPAQGEKEKMMEEEMKMAMEFRDKMGAKLKSIELTGSSDGVTVRKCCSQVDHSCRIFTHCNLRLPIAF
jgi:hypothetical protein